MTIKIHNTGNSNVAEIISEEVVIHTVEDALNLLGNLYYENVDKIFIHEKNITPDFFDLKTKIAGEILQKFSNYRTQLAIIGDFSKYTSKSLQDFIFESNNRKQIIFAPTVEDGLKKFS